jgi:hypothetical protein
MAIGGYNQLSLPNNDTDLHTNAYKFQSARAALYAYLNTIDIDTIYLPNYICDSVIPAIIALDIKVVFYSINKRLLPVSLPELGVNETNSKILVINYFGLLGCDIKMITASNPSLFIIDNSQALFCEHIEETTAIYSPRKFLGIPDGGFLHTTERINMPNEIYDASKKVSHLLLRAAGDVEGGYKCFLEAEQALECFIPKRMSDISEYLISCADINVIKEKRHRNYEFLYDYFKALNLLDLPLNAQMPLCYPLKVTYNVESICKEFVDSSIFLPRYWASDYNGEVGQSMFENTLFLPIDERLADDDVQALSDIIMQRIKNEY